MTGLYGCWLEANQFGKPVASFSLGPGIILPDNKLECVLSRLTNESIVENWCPGRAHKFCCHDLTL